MEKLMQILNSQEIHLQPTDTRFGPSKIKAIFVFLIITGFLSIFWIVTLKEREWVPFAIVMFISVIILLTASSWVFRAFKKDGWKVAIQNKAILLKADITGKGSQDILEILYHEINSLRKIRERYISYKGGKSGNRTNPVRFDALDIQLTPDAFTQLETLLGAGATGLEMAASCRLIYPTGTSMLNTNAIINQIEAYCRTLEPELICYDMPDLKDTQQVNSYILFLVRRNHKMDAQQLARKAFGLGLRESKDYVAKLLQKAA
jgi:hypothetical protein